MPIEINGRKKYIGFFFETIDMLASHLHFTYKLVHPGDNIVGNTTHGGLSLLYINVIVTYVCI